MAPGVGDSVGRSLSVAGLISFGTFTSLAAKIVYELDGTGRDGHTKTFEKPWAMTTVVFLGMTFALPVAYYESYLAKKKRKAAAAAAGDASEPLLRGAEGSEPSGARPGTGLKEILMLAIPTAFDLVATALMNIGLLTVTASVYQMMRGAEMLFAALFAVVFLKRSLNRLHYAGIGCCMVGIVLVGCSSMLSGEGSVSHDVDPSAILMGMALIVLSQAVQAAQITFEDFFMEDLAISPLMIVGYEGLFGTLAMLFVMLPLVQRLPGQDGQGIHEDSVDTWHMITSSGVIATVLVVDMAALLMYNVAGMMVTGHLGAVFRTVLETMRTLFVWLVDLLLFYTPLGLGKLGESWTRYSLIQAAGFVVLVAGTVVYSRGDEREIAAAIAEGVFDAEAAAADEAGGLRRPVSGPLPVAQLPVTPSVPMSMGSSSLKSTMNMSAFSLPGSMSRSLMRQRISSPPPRFLAP